MPNMSKYRPVAYRKFARDRGYKPGETRRSVPIRDHETGSFSSVLPRIMSFDGMSAGDILDYNAKYKALSDWYLNNGASSWDKVLADTGMAGTWHHMDGTQRLEAMSAMLGLAKDANGKYRVGGETAPANGTWFMTPPRTLQASPTTVLVQGAGLPAAGTHVVPSSLIGGNPPPPSLGAGGGWRPLPQPAPHRGNVWQQVSKAPDSRPAMSVGDNPSLSRPRASDFSFPVARAAVLGGRSQRKDPYREQLRREALEREYRREEAEHQKWLKENSGFTAYTSDNPSSMSNSGGGRLTLGSRRNPLEELDQSAKLKALQDWYKDNSKDFSGILEKYGMNEESWAKLDPWSRVQMGSKMLDLQGNDDGTYSVGYTASFRGPNSNYNPDVWDAIKKRGAATPPTERHFTDGAAGFGAGASSGAGASPGAGMEPGKMYLGGSARFDEKTGRYRW